MFSLLTTVNAVFGVLFRGKNTPEVNEVEFTPFDLSYLNDLPKETGRPGSVEPARVPVFPTPVPFNSPQV
jgi:hypothetical protein